MYTPVNQDTHTLKYRTIFAYKGFENNNKKINQLEASLFLLLLFHFDYKIGCASDGG